MLGDRLCSAAAEASGFDAVVLSAVYDPSAPVLIGASGPEAAAAEHAELTAGEGPVQHAFLAGAVSLLVDLHDPDDVGRRCWPTWSVLLQRATFYRSALTVPVPAPVPLPVPASFVGGPPASQPTPPPSTPWRVPLMLSCYRRAPLATASTPIQDAVHSIGAARVAAEALAAAISTVLGQVTAAESGQPEWLDAEHATRRAHVWRAEELLMNADPQLLRAHALTALRMFALVHGVFLEQVAADLLTGQITVEQVRGHLF